MRAISLEYHDVVDPGEFARSGFQGAGSDLYKLFTGQFRSQMARLANAGIAAPGRVDRTPANASTRPVFLTFDDGGASALSPIAEILAEFNSVGHFFVTTNFIDTPGFLTRSQIQEVARLGHVVGSHSCSHPTQMAHCTDDQLLSEWTESRARLMEILGEDVRTASVPGGLYSNRVAQAASKAGLSFLFNSEPVTAVNEVGSCKVFGRFTITRATSEQNVLELAQGSPVARGRQYLAWNSKKPLKKLFGSRYPEFRRRLLRIFS